MEVRCPSCATRYAIPDDKVRGRKGRFPCHRCGTKVIIDGTSIPPPSGPAVPAVPVGGPPSSRAAGPVKRPLPPIPGPPPRAATAATAASTLSGADEEDEATRLVTSVPALLRPSAAVKRPPKPEPPRREPPKPEPPQAELSDAIDEDEATRMVSIIVSEPASAPRTGNEELTMRAPMDGPGGLRAALEAARRDPGGGGTPRPAPDEGGEDEEDATRMLSAHVPGARLSDAPREDEATRVFSAAEQSKLAETARPEEDSKPEQPTQAEKPIESEKPPEAKTAPAEPALQAKAPSPVEASVRRKSSGQQEVTGKTRIVVRTQAPPPTPSPSSLPRVLLLMVAAGAGGYVLSQVTNARRAQSAGVVAPPAVPAPGRPAIPFDERAARAALLAAASTAGPACPAAGGPGGEVVVDVRFLPSGRAIDSRVEGVLGQTETGLCIARRFDQVVINAFDGDPVALSTRVVIP